jgi:hypothetical protein
MHTTLSPTPAATVTHVPRQADVEIPQYRRGAILAGWAAATLPVGALGWLTVPILADRFTGAGHIPMPKALMTTLAVGQV